MDATWSSRAVFILASIGAAVGLGNIWKFPYLAGSSGGSAFVLVYLAAVVLVAVPILIAEMLLGRRGRSHPAGAIARLAVESGCRPAWGWVGGLGVIVAWVIMTYYSVIAGWAMAHVWPTLSGGFAGADAGVTAAHFDALLASPVRLMAWAGVYTAVAVAIVARGLHSGIERSISLLMPALFLALLLLVAYGLVEGEVAPALQFLFAPDFSRIDGSVVLAAVGQAFFSVGVGMGIMITYGSYLPRDVSLVRSAFLIAGADTLVALLAGIALFPLVFANGLDPAAGPGLVFVTLPIAFGNMPGGQLFGGIFFCLLVVAALTSSIAAIEPMVRWLIDRRGWSRPKAAWIAGGLTWVAGLATVLSFNLWKDWHPLGALARFQDKTFFDLLDYATSNLLMPLCALLLAVFVGWRMRAEESADELGLGSPFQFLVWRNVLLKWLVPAAIAAILLAGV
ncbi:MAG: sodium-dependent transporter [Steroidobacteraceae bacterium]